jgi:putative salt-induced outer membrane protein
MKKSLSMLLLVPCMAVAGEWKGEGELGFTSTSGNTDSDTLNAKLSISKEHDKWLHKAALETLKASTNNIDSADSLVFTEKTEYKLSDKTYAFIGLRHEDDAFSGFDYQQSISLGVGYQFIKNDTHSLDASAGLGYRRLKETVTAVEQDEDTLVANASYEFIISEHATFTEKLMVESGDSNTHSESETALKMKVVGNLAAKISYLIKQNSDVPVGTEKQDKITTVTLVYSF